MKRICIFLLIVVILGQIQGVCAKSYGMGDDVEEVIIGYSSPYLDERDIYSGYTTTNRNEIKMLTHFLESLTQIGGGGIPSDSKQICITLKYNCGNSKRFDIYPTSLNVIENTNYSIYQFPITEYYRMCDFINCLILDKFDEDTAISTEASKWAEMYVDKAITEGIVLEWNQIGYKNYVPRVEVCQLIDALFNEKGINKEVPNDYTYLKEYPFDDTKDISVKELYIKNIVKGKSGTKFYPYDNITREEFAKILANTYSVISNINSSVTVDLEYTDTIQISDWAIDSVKVVSGLGLMQGNDESRFNPKTNITKEEVIVTLLRLYELN